MKNLRFEKLRNTKEDFEVFLSLILPYCKELDRNACRQTPEETLIGFAQSILNMASDKDRFIELCYAGTS